VRPRKLFNSVKFCRAPLKVDGCCGAEFWGLSILVFLLLNHIIFVSIALKITLALCPLN